MTTTREALKQALKQALELLRESRRYVDDESSPQAAAFVANVWRAVAINIPTAIAATDAEEAKPADNGNKYWHDPLSRLPEDGAIVKALLQHADTKTIQQHKLRRVVEDDCEWRTADDNSAILYDWSVIAWQYSAPIQVDEEAKPAPSEQTANQVMADKLLRAVDTICDQCDGNPWEMVDWLTTQGGLVQSMLAHSAATIAKPAPEPVAYMFVHNDATKMLYFPDSFSAKSLISKCWKPIPLYASLPAPVDAQGTATHEGSE